MRPLLAIFMIVTTAVSQPDFKVTNFKYHGNGFRVEGTRAEKHGNRITIRDARLIILGQNDLMLVWTPELELDLKSQRAFSKAKVKIRSRRFIARGVGFDVDTEAKRFAIRSKVHIAIIGDSINF